MPQRKSIATASSDSIQRKWTTAGVNNVLAKGGGEHEVNALNAQKYKVIHFDSYKFTRQFYHGPFNWFKDGSPKPMEKNGWHNRSRKEIAISDQRDDGGAASTLVHEVAHANQHQINEQNIQGGLDPAYRDKLAKEVDAHIKQEEFNLTVNLPPKDPSFRTKGNDIDHDAIARYVQRVYAVGANARAYVDSTPVWNTIETIKPWPWS